MRPSQHIQTVQMPIIPLIGQWTANSPDTLSLGQGMVSYPPPASALQAIHDFGTQSAQHVYGASLGNAELLTLIKAKLKTENDIDANHYEIMVTAGANMAFLNILLAIVDPFDEIILPLPYYFNQEMAIRMVHCKPVFVKTKANYQLDVEAIRLAITNKTRAIVTVSPNNPSGAVYGENDLRAVNALCAEYGLYHICDEAYEYFIYENAQHFSPASIKGAETYTISLYSLSKAFGFASWRIGYVVFPKNLLTPLLKVQDTNLICPPLITQIAAIGALKTGSSYCKQQLKQLAVIRLQVIEQLMALNNYCQLTITDGAFYILLKLHTNKEDLSLVKSLIDEFKVAVIPGRAFGLHEGCYVRLSYGMLDETRMRVALNRFINGIKQLC